EHIEACYGTVFAPALTDYYGWTIPKGGTVNVGAAFPRSANVVSRFADLVHELRVAGFGIGDELERASAPLLKPTVPSDLRLARREVALVGEAAGFISPSSAEGISYALRSAAALAAAIDSAPHDPAYEYRRFARPLVAEVLGKMVKSRILQTKGLRRAALLTGVGALPEGDIDGFAGSLGELLMP
ncbi:MAG TPA: hypothetical protein VLA05_06185, partial [Coriobacteriia bacterium]|nr:hypothetical protein [Coriobacteriia bacterium]